MNKMFGCSIRKALSDLSGHARFLSWLLGLARYIASSGPFCNVDLAMAQWAMLELEIVQFTLKGLVLASLARVILLCKDALAAGDAWTEVAAAVPAVDVVLGDACLTLLLRAVELLLRSVHRRMSAKQVNRKHLI